MLASRRDDPDVSHPWSFGKLEASPFALPLSLSLARSLSQSQSLPRPAALPISPRASSSPRMSNAGFATPLSSATEWTAQYSFLAAPAEPMFASQAYSADSSGGAPVTAEPDRAEHSRGDDRNVMASASSTSPSQSQHSHPHTHPHPTQTTPRPSTSANGDGSGSTKASSASPLGLHHRRGLDPLGLRPLSQMQAQHHHAGGTIRSPSTPAGEQQQQQQQHHYQNHQHQQHHQHHQYQQHQQLQQHQQHHQPYTQHPYIHHQQHHGSTPHDTSPLLSNPLSSSMANPLSAVLQLPGIVTHFGSPGHAHSMNHMGHMGMGHMGHMGHMGNMSGMGGMNGMGGMGHGDDQSGIKTEDDDFLDGDDMGDAGDGDMLPLPQTAAERISQRRKMKRFRLSHQQTRFLMSEFAKQPHPDAAHRERLSREIPGLSPRQVQVWFQNRRAKIKRLAADDRERMVKMRAVPDDFDNVQALHSPYGAVHGLGTPMASPVDFNAAATAVAAAAAAAASASPYGDHMSPTGLTPSFGSIGFSASAGAMSSADILSPLSPTSSSDHHRYGSYASQLTTSGSATSTSSAATVGGPRTSMPYTRPGTGSLDTGSASATAGAASASSPGNSGSNTTPAGTNTATTTATVTITTTNNNNNTNSNTSSAHQQRHPMRPLQPLQLRETMSRSRSDNLLQSPLRSSMSWKGDALDYNSYHTGSGSGSGSPLAGRQSLYADSYDYSGSTVRSPTQASAGFPSPGLLATSPGPSSRLCAASATQPLALDVARHPVQRGSYVDAPLYGMPPSGAGTDTALPGHTERTVTTSGSLKRPN